MSQTILKQISKKHKVKVVFFSCAKIVFNELYNVFIASIVNSICSINFKSRKMKKKNQLSNVVNIIVLIS